MPFLRALITGGAGFLGSHLCEQLVDTDTEVVCLDNLSTGHAENRAHLEHHPGFTLIEVDVTDRLPLLPRFDLVCHLASPASPVHYQRLGVATLRAGADGTARALHVAAGDGARFLLASTSEVYGDPAVHPQTESYWGNVNPVGPRSVYDEAKRYAEALTAAYHRDHGTDVCIARIFNTYGPRMRCDDGRMIPTFVQQALAGRDITVSGSARQTRSICYVDDTVRGLILLAESGHAGPVNLGSPVEMTVHGKRRAGARSCRELVTNRAGACRDRRPATTLPGHLTCSSCPRLEPALDAREGLRRTADWFRKGSADESPPEYRAGPRTKLRIVEGGEDMIAFESEVG